jgi:hypothetical protein
MRARDLFSVTARCVLGLAITFTIGAHLYIFRPWTDIWAIWIIFFLSLAWGLLPYGILLGHVNRLAKRDARAGGVLVLLLAGVILAAFASKVYFQAFWAYGDGTYGDEYYDAGLLYRIPMAQNMAALIAVALASGVSYVAKRLVKPEADQQPPAIECSNSNDGFDVQPEES